MKYKLAAADLDGTLLDKSSQITDATVAAVKAAQKEGLIFTICTGRAQSTVVMGYIERLGLACPVITYNGAMLIKPDGEIVYRRDLEDADADLRVLILDLMELAQGFRKRLLILDRAIGRYAVAGNFLGV